MMAEGAPQDPGGPGAGASSLMGAGGEGLSESKVSGARGLQGAGPVQRSRFTSQERKDLPTLLLSEETDIQYESCSLLSDFIYL